MAGPPPRTVIQAPRFAKAKRRFPPEAQLQVDEAVRGVIENPLAGAPKTGGLKGIRVVKFKIGPTQLLLAYEFHVKLNRIDLLDVGPHENFYRDLQKYLGAK
jgi:mRNA-degrading endonuclease RelE of RelBE toxin-antitoxin system